MVDILVNIGLTRTIWNDSNVRHPHRVPCVPGFPYDASSVVCFQEGPVAEFASKHLASQ